MREIGDNNVYALLVECALMRLTLFTEYDVEGSTAEYTDVVFTGLLAHSLDPVMSGNILSKDTVPGKPAAEGLRAPARVPLARLAGI